VDFPMSSDTSDQSVHPVPTTRLHGIEPDTLDVIPPARMAELVQNVGLRKMELTLFQTLTLGVLAGAFIAFGSMFFTVVITGSTLGYGPTLVLGGAAFSLGLILVIVGGAELFTGNSLIVMAWASRSITTRALLRNWTIVYLGNLVGALATAFLVHLSGTLLLANGEVGQTAVSIALQKLSLDPLQAFVRGILCNILVCLAVWMCFAARSVTGKILSIIFPVTAFVALGFEHSIANMYLLPVAMLHMDGSIDVVAMLANLVPVTAGNVVGGGFLVAMVYWLVYLRPGRQEI
jgi:formate transporter